MTDLLENGVVLMATGMGTVFLLLTALVFIIQGISKMSLWLAPAMPRAAAPQGAPLDDKPAADAELVTVIGAAVAAYRRDNKTGK
jgi:sodium pump decarboxylase gamma subunit